MQVLLVELLRHDERQKTPVQVVIVLLLSAGSPLCYMWAGQNAVLEESNCGNRSPSYATFVKGKKLIVAEFRSFSKAPKND